jgi:hypothetical protein
LIAGAMPSRVTAPVNSSTAYSVTASTLSWHEGVGPPGLERDDGAVWTAEDVAQLILEPTDGNIQWVEAGDGSRHADHGDDRLVLRRDDQERIVLSTVPRGALEITVLADSLNPEIGDLLAELWEAAS